MTSNPAISVTQVVTMRRLIMAATLLTFTLSHGFVSSALADEKAADTTKCEYGKCSTPWLAGGGLKNPPVAGERQKGFPTSICQTPINWCVIGPAPVGASCFCWQWNGTALYGITVR
jgi:hypothetical protein